MGWTPLFIKTDKMKVLILGAGEVGERRASRFIQAGAEVILTGGTVSNNLQNMGAIFKPLEKIEELVEWADLVVIASGDKELNNKVAHLAGEKLLNRADDPLDGNVIVPTTFSVGDAQISIFTGGKSPLMARMLRKKIQASITPEDILQIELQDHARLKLKSCIGNQKLRRDYLYQISQDPEIKKCLGENRLEDAISLADSFINNLDCSNSKIKSKYESNDKKENFNGFIKDEKPENHKEESF